jgi:hypothetical protein
MNRIFSNEKKAISPIELNTILNNYELCSLMNNLSNEDFKVLGKLFNNINQGDFCLIINSLNNQTAHGIQPPKYESNNYQQLGHVVNGNRYNQNPKQHNGKKYQHYGKKYQHNGKKYQHNGKKYQHNGRNVSHSQGQNVYTTINTNGYNGLNGRKQHGNRQLELPYYE